MKKLSVFFFLLALVTLAKGQSYKSDKIVVFKNGLAFFEKHTFANVVNNKIVLNNLPYNVINTNLPQSYSQRSKFEQSLVMGTLRFAAPNNTILNVSYQDTITYMEATTGYSLAEMIYANKGKNVSIKTKMETTIVTGKILDLADSKVVVQQGNAYHYIDVQSIDLISFLQEPKVEKTKSLNTKHFLSLDLLKNTNNQKVNISYLQRGISWIPNYFIDVLDNNKVQLSLYANLINDVEDIENVPMSFVVGIPSFTFESISSPMASNNSVLQTLSDLSDLADGSNSRRTSPMLSQNAITSNYSTYDIPSTNMGDGEDMFFYTKKNVSIKKGARQLLPILDIQTSYTDIYMATLNTNLEDDDRLADYDNDHKVWRNIVFKNTADVPLTTGTAFFKKEKDENSILSQNMIDFTPTGKEVRLKVNIAPDIVVNQEEEDVDSKELNKYYEILQIEGKIVVSNYKSVPVEIEISRVIYGKLGKSSTKWEYATVYGTPNNSKNMVSWKLKVPASSKEEITYKYEVTVR